MSKNHPDITDCIQVCDGRYFNLRNPAQNWFSLDQIATALSRICRFTGHTRKFYSVAQHSVLVSRVAPEQFAFAALMHDSAEAYVGDVASPLKAMVANYASIEAGIVSAIAKVWGFPYPLPDAVKHADLIALATERRDLMAEHRVPWGCLHGIAPVAERIIPVDCDAAKEMFMQRFGEVAYLAARAERVCNAKGGDA